jgi:hypothetical protein
MLSSGMKLPTARRMAQLQTLKIEALNLALLDQNTASHHQIGDLAGVANQEGDMRNSVWVWVRT